MNIKLNNTRFKKFLSVIVSLFVINSFVLNDCLFAFTQPLMPVINQSGITSINMPNAKITDTFINEKKFDDNFVIFIQDLHGNISVQKNISEILKDLDAKYKIDTILLEGIPSGEANLSALQELKKYNVDDLLLKRNVLTGPEYFVMNNSTNAKIYGLEDWDKYINNIKRNAQILKDKEYLTETYFGFEKALYSKIKNLKKLQQYINLDLVNEDLLKTMNQPILQYTDLHKYVSISKNIKNIKQKKVTKEYVSLLKDLKNDLSFKEYNTLIDLSNKDDLTEYYNNLYEKTATNEKYLNKYNELFHFLKYTSEKTQLNLVSLISQQNKFFNKYLSSISSNKTQQDLFMVKMTQLFKLFIQLSISDEDYTFFIDNYERYINLLPNYLSQEYYDYEDLLFDDLLFEYHKENKDRNSIFIKNIVDSLNKKTDRNKLTVVVAGGFHSSISQYFKDNNISYLFITPNISGQTTNIFYNEIVSSTDALAPIKIMLANTGFLQEETIAVFFQYFIDALASANNYSAENVEKILSSIITDSAKNINPLFGNIPISVKKTDSSFTIDIDGQELIFTIENGKIIWEKSSVQYNNYQQRQEKKRLIEQFVSVLRKRFNIFQATSMRLNPELKYSSKFFSKRLGKRKNLFFTLSMFFSAIKRYSLAYDLMMGYATYTNKDNIVSYSINFDDDFFKDMKTRQEFAPFIGKSITILVEKGLEEYLTEDDIKELLKDSIKRVREPITTFKDTLFIGFLDKSTNLFEDHLNNGFIGVNRAIFEVEDNTVKHALLKTGIIHEISHELKGKLSSKEYRNFEGKMMYDDIKYLIDFVAKTDYNKKKEQILEKDEVLKIKQQILNAFYKEQNGQLICLFTEKNRFMKKIMNYKYSVNDMVGVVVKKNISDERRREVELRHLEECLSPEDPNDPESVSSAGERQREFFYNLFDPVPKALSFDEFIEEHISEERAEEVEGRKLALYIKYRNILNISYPNELESKIVLSRKDLGRVRTMPAAELKQIKEILGIDANKKFKDFSKTEIIKVIMMSDFINNFDTCIEAMYKVMPTWMFEAYYNEQGMVSDHALNHSMEVLSTAMDLIALDFNHKVDMKTMIYSALLHDISCTIFRQNHEINSSTWARRILQNGTNLTRKEIDKICVVGANHKKYKKPLPEEKAIRPAHNINGPGYVYEACLLHDADGLAATLDFARVLGVWLAQGDPFINPNLKTKIIDKTSDENDRISLIKRGLYLRVDGGDAINDLMRQFYRRNPDFYFTKGAREFADAAFQDQYALIKFLDSPEIRELLEAEHISEQDINDAIEIINETFATDNLIPKYESITIEELRETLRVRTDEKVDSSVKKESVFNLSSKISTLYRILFNLPSHSNIILSDMHGGYNRLSEILIKLLDSTYNIDEIMRIFNNGDLNKDSLTEEETDEIEETRKKLNKDIISRIKTIKKNIYILGDMLDRGDKQVETFELMNQISKTGKLKYIIGNHDLYAFMNLLGLHLPFYDNYKGISKDYTVDLFDGTTQINIYQLLENKRKLGIGVDDKTISEEDREREQRKANNKKHWARKLYEYMQHADAVQRKWTKDKNENGITKEQELQQLFKETFGFELHEKGKDVLNTPTDIFAQDKELLGFHKKFFGRNVGVVVYTGIRAVNKMSLNWWKDRNTELSNLKSKYPQYENYWNRLQKEIDTIITEQQRTLEEKYLSDEWEWLVIDSIMYRNYESTEWNALDWVFHNNWGGGTNGFLNQLNRKIKRELEKEKQAKIKLIEGNYSLSEERKKEEKEKLEREFDKKLQEELVTPVTYFDNPLIQDLLKFYHKNFYLYRKDHFGNCYMHSILPVDDNGEVSIGHVDEEGVFIEMDEQGVREKGFVYNKKRYQNKSILKGLGQIAEDIRDYDISSEDLSQVMEAFTLLTAVYADNTTRIKPANLKQMKEKFGGFFSILNKMGISTLVVGHNPISKMGTRFELEKLRFFNRELDRQKLTILNADGEMSSGYQKPFGAGLGIEMTLFGVRYRGFLTGSSETFSGDYTPDVSEQDTKFTIVLNIFPGLKRILLLTEKAYDNFFKMISSLRKIKDYLGGNIITASNSTILTVTTEDELKASVEKAYLNGISVIPVIANRLQTFSQEEKITETSVEIRGIPVQVSVYLNKILIGNGKIINCLSYEYQKTSIISDEEIKAEINKYIFNMIKNKQFAKHGIKTSKNILTDINIDGTFEQNKKTVADSLQKALTNSFGILPLLYDLNLQTSTDIDSLTTDINIDKIKNILSAA